jgi:hypothetical protein
VPQFDGDESGILEMVEVKKALRWLSSSAQNASMKASDYKQLKEASAAVAEALMNAAEATMAMEREEARLKAIRHPESSGSLRVRLGAQLRTRNLKVGDMIRFADEDGSQTLDPQEMHRLINDHIGITASETNDLFAELDQDGDGMLSMAELRLALKTMQDEAASAVDMEKEHMKSVKDKRSLAKQAQSAAFKLQSELYARWPQVAPAVRCDPRTSKWGSQIDLASRVRQ